MLDYKIELKSSEEIKALCMEVEGSGLGQDGIGFDHNVLFSNDFYSNNIKLVGVNNYTDNDYAYIIQNSIGNKIYIHLDWIASFKGSPVIAHKELTDELTLVSRKYLLNKTTGELSLKSSLPTCSHCDALGTITMADGNYLCKSCNDKLTIPLAWNWQPSPFEFIGEQLPKDVDNPIWYGLEIEMSTNKEKLGKFMYEYGHKLYLKNDSSIRGDGHRVEMVSHPHSFKALMADSSWLSNIATVPTNDTDSNGCHVHISRTSFINDRHYSLFYFLMHKMVDIATKVGGRGLTNYCELRPSGKVHSKANDKYETNGRSLFLNECNAATIEARFFKGTTDVSRLKGYVQLLESVIKYTKYHPDGGTVSGWFEYVTQKSRKYKELLEVVGTLSEDDKKIEIIYREPIRKNKKTNQLSLSDVDKIVEIRTTDGDVYKGHVSRTEHSDKRFRFSSDREGTVHIYFRDIESIVVEEE